MRPPAAEDDPEAEWHHACTLAALAERAVLPVIVAGMHLVVVREGGRVFAMERVCPHEGADLALGRCAAGRLFCPRHLASFDLADGSVSQGWRFRGLRTFPVRIVDGNVEVDAGSLIAEATGR